MEFKHTPGEWSLPHFATSDPNKEGHQCSCGYVFAEGQRGMGAICDVYFNDGSEGKQENETLERAIANARLIAAAPDLLLELVALREAIIAHIAGADVPTNDPYIDQRIAFSADAIAKATGETV